MAEFLRMPSKTQKGDTGLPSQNPHDVGGVSENSLETAIGQQVRHFRQKLNMTVSEMAKQAGLSAGMLSKIENGSTSPSLSTLKAVSEALNVPVTALFQKYEEHRDVSYVPAGQGLKIERRGTRAGHQYNLLGHAVGNAITVEPYLISLNEESDVFPVFQHGGMEFIYMLEGEVTYRHGDELYVLNPGDSLLFDADALHGPEKLNKLPISYLSIISYTRISDD
ncbi:helix-turn-helix domain-containing protein [Rhodovibrionaceae bacterium A322]